MKQKNCIATEPLFAEKLREAIDEALLALGNSPREAIYYHLEKKFNVKRDNVHEQIEEFTRALESIFGPGAKYILNLAAKNLCLKLNLPYEKRNLQFVDFMIRVQETTEGNVIQAKPKQRIHR